MSTVIDWQHIINTSACDQVGCVAKAAFMTPAVGDGYIHYWCEQHDPEHRHKTPPIQKTPYAPFPRQQPVRYVNTHHAGIYGIPGGVQSTTNWQNPYSTVDIIKIMMGR